jgi:hypothetical protein
MTALLDATVPEIVAEFLGPDVVLDCATRRLADPERLRVHIGSHSRGMSGPGYEVRTEKYGCRWANSRGEGVLFWPELWRLATAGATPGRVRRLVDAYGAYVRHVVDEPDDPEVYERVVDELHAASAAVVLAAPAPVEQLDLFGGAA